MDQVQELKDRIISFETAKESYEKQIFDLERELGLSKLTTTILEERMEEAREEFAAKERIHLKMMRSVKKAMTVEGGVVSNSDGLRQAEAEQGEREAARKERNGATTNKRNGKRARAGKEVEGAPSSKRYYHVEDAEVIKKKHIDEFDRNQDKLLLSNKQILEKLKEHKFRTQCDDWSRLMRLTGLSRGLCTDLVAGRVERLSETSRKVISNTFKAVNERTNEWRDGEIKEVNESHCFSNSNK